MKKQETQPIVKRTVNKKWPQDDSDIGINNKDFKEAIINVLKSLKYGNNEQMGISAKTEKKYS